MRQAIMIAVLLAAPAAAQEEFEMTVEDVPADVLATAQEAAPGKEFSRIQGELQDNELTYEFITEDEDGRALEIDVRGRDARLMETEHEISMDEVPAAVKTVLESRLPGFKPNFVERSERPADPLLDEPAATVFEFEGMGSDGSDIDAWISADGAEVEIASDFED